MSTDAKRAGNARYLAKLKTWTIRIKPDEAEKIEQAAAAAGQSKNEYVLEAVRRRMEQEQADKEAQD